MRRLTRISIYSSSGFAQLARRGSVATPAPVPKASAAAGGSDVGGGEGGHAAINSYLVPVGTSIGKTIRFGGDAREEMLRGIERIAKAVCVTLGPKGRNVVIRQRDGEPKITKDGVTVARSIAFTNHFEDVGAKLIRQVAAKTNLAAGDGTTTATVLAWSIFEEGYKAVATGANPMDLKRGIDTAVEVLCQSLKRQTRVVSSLDALKDVATISANGERRLGSMIAEAVHAVGSKGYISVLESRTPETTWQQHDGWSIEQGFSSSVLLTDLLGLRCEFPTALVFILRGVTGKLTNASTVLTMAEAALRAGKPLVIVGPQIGGDALELLEFNHAKGVLKTCLVAVSSEEEEALDDLAASLGCTVLTVESLLRAMEADAVGSLGGVSCGVSQTMDSTVIKGSADVEPAIRLLERQLERTTGERERDRLMARAAKLSKSFAVVRVGGLTTVEVGESKDRVVDALNAARAAVAEGIVAGGGTALLLGSKCIDEVLKLDEDMPQDRRTGMMIVRNAVRLPMRMICDNAGVEGAVVVENVLETDDASKGYDAQNELYVDMFAAGIVDPTRVVRSCLVDAASVAGLMITTEAIVVDDEFGPRLQDEVVASLSSLDKK